MPFLKISEEIQAKILEQLQTKEMRELAAKTLASEDSGRFKIVISTQDEDRQGEVIDQNGWDFSKYLANPIVLWAHDYKQLPIGITDKLYKEGMQLIAEGKFVPGDCNPFAQQVRKLYDLGVQRAASVGLIGKEVKGNVITKSELLEWSFVPVPANPYALKLDAIKANGIDLELMRSKGIEITQEEEPKVEEKGVTEDILDANKQLRMAKHEYTDDMWYALYDFMDAYFSDATPLEGITTLTDELCVKLKAIAAGQEVESEAGDEMEMFMDAFTGAAIKSNIVKKLKDREKLTESEIKSLKAVEAVEKALTIERLKAGKVLSDKNRTLLQTSVEQINSCAAALQELLDATDPQGDGGKADDAAAQKQRSNAAGSLEKDLTDYFTMRTVLRLINNVTSESLAKLKKERQLIKK